MQTNGFGSVRQEIVVSVSVGCWAKVQEEFRLRGWTFEHKRETEDGQVVFTWFRWTSKSDDDETIVYALGFALDDVTGLGGWKVLWDETNF